MYCKAKPASSSSLPGVPNPEADFRLRPQFDIQWLLREVAASQLTGVDHRNFNGLAN